MATVPLVRANDPVVRERRSGPRRGDSRMEPARTAANVSGERTGGGAESQFLRPVTRLPDAALRGAAEGVEIPVEPAVGLRSSRATRQLYHPDPDEIFNLPSRRASEPGPALAQGPDRSDRDSAVPGEGAAVAPAGAEPAWEGLASGGIEQESTEQGNSRTASSEVPWAQALDLRADGASTHEDLEDVFTLEAVPPHRAHAQKRQTRWAWGGLLLVAVAAAGIAFVNRGRFAPTMLKEHDAVVLTAIENSTGDEMLDGSVAEGLQIALAQSPYLRMTNRLGYTAALGRGSDEDGVNAIRARTAAQRMGAHFYLYGRISPDGVHDSGSRGAAAGYAMHVQLMNVSTNDVLGTFDERAGSLQEIPGAIDRLADDIRASAGEDVDSISASHNALIREATGSLEALHAFTLAEQGLAVGRTVDAIAGYQKAVALDPHFVQAYLRLALVYRKQRAEVAAADAAKLGLSSSDTTSERTRMLAQYEYEMNASGNFTRATAVIRKQVAADPQDSEALSDLARVLRIQGKLTEALQSAQGAIAADAYNLDAYIQASTALISLDRYEASLTMEQTAQRLGLSRVGGNLIGSYLEGRQAGVNQAVAEYRSTKPGHRADWTFGLYLDNSGRLTEGLELWRTNASAAARIKGLESASAYLLAQGALDRALVGDCGNALALVREASGKPRGLVTLFNSGMASAVCGDRTAGKNAIEDLQRQYPQSTDVEGYYVADLEAALALQANDPATALEQLRPTRQYDLISLTPYLRGLAHVALRQMQIGIVDFQVALSHRGIEFIVGSDVYPMAQIGVARAFAATGDAANSAAAYRQFLSLWRDADPALALVTEARKGSR